MIKCNDTFTKLHEVILGQVGYGSDFENMYDIDIDVRGVMDRTHDELNVIQSVFESRGIKVRRPIVIMSENNELKLEPINIEMDTPYFSSSVRIPLTPRDNFAIMNDTILETSSWQQVRMFDSFAYRDIFMEYFDQGAKWISMPLNRGIDIPSPEEFIDIDPQYDAACMLKYGKDIFTTKEGACNKRGLDWMIRMFPEYTFHIVENISGHIDTHLTILRPGLLMTHLNRRELPDYFKKWDILNVDPREEPKHAPLIDPTIQDEDFDNSVLAVNSLSLDENTIMMYSHYAGSTHLRRQFDKHKIEPIFVDLTHSHFFNQGLTCLTLDVCRDGDFIRYE